MSRTSIPDSVQLRLWGKAAGRCEYEGCNEPLWIDSLTKDEFNIAYIAHIIADKPRGPRGHETLSDELKADISNLMVLCDKHHRLIDKEDEAGHSPERLREMKRRHEARIEILGSIQEDSESQIILYGANIGEHSATLSWKKAALAMASLKRYPAEIRAIELSLKNSAFEDHENSYWDIEKEHLLRQYQQQIKPRLSEGQIQHFSIFGLAPQPLLIQLGRLLSDIPAAEVFQLHREPPDWKWQEHREDFEYMVDEPISCCPDVAINFSLSATIDNSRISSVLENDHSIWRFSVADPNNDFLKSREQLSLFRKQYRGLLNRIKAKHGEKAVIHLFLAVPVAVALEIGRVWMPKADLPMYIYDQNRKTGGFTKAINISE